MARFAPSAIGSASGSLLITSTQETTPQLTSGSGSATPSIATAQKTIAMAGTGVSAAPSITTQPASKTVTAGQTATFSVTSSGAAPLSYQWSKNGAAITGATSASYTTPATATSDSESQFTVVVSNSAGSVTSNAATLTVTAAAVAPSITTQPTSQTVTAGQTATFSVTSSGAAPLNYQWSKNGAAITGATSASYTTPATAMSDSGSRFTVVVGNSAGNVTSNAATLTVTAVSVAPSITTQPFNQIVTAGQTATFSVTASGTSPLNYQWRKNGTTINITTSPSYTTPATAISDSGSAFNVAISNSTGSVTSNTVTLTVNATPVAITVTPNNATVIVGSTQQFSPNVTGTSNTAVTWSVSGVGCTGAACGMISASGLYTSPSSVPSPATVTVKATSVVDPTKSASASVTIIAAAAVLLSISPTSASVPTSGMQLFTASVTGTSNTAVTWGLSGAGCSASTCGTLSTSSLSAVYSAPSVAPSPTTVNVTAISVADPTKSASANVAIVPLVAVIVTPANASVSSGTTQQFDASVTGALNTAVAWSVSGTWCNGVGCGTIASNGVYSAPSTVPSPSLVTVSATSVADPTRVGTVDLTILPKTTAGGPTTPITGGGSTTTITLNGQSYTLKAHPRTYFDGPGGVIDTGIKDPDGPGAGVALKAAPGNPAWQGLLTRSSFWYNTYPYNDFNNQQDYSTGQYAAGFAMAWYSDNSRTAYHDAALYMLNNIEKYLPSLCDENSNGCYFADATGYSIGSYGAVYWFQEWMFAYELMRGEMTSPQRQAFAAKWLNDIAAFGGVDGSPTTRCANPTKNAGVGVTVAGGVIAASSPLFGPGNAIQVGDWVVADSGDTYPAPILRILDSTHATLPARSAPQGWNGYSGTISLRRAAWQAGDCGLMWAAKHGRYAPKSITWVNGASGYPGWGGNAADTTNNTFAWYQGAQAVFLSLVDDDLNASTRSQVELTTLYNDFYSNMYLANLSHAWTGFHLMGSVYGYERPLKVAMVNAQLQMSIQGTAPAIGGIWDKNMLYHPVMNWMPSCATGEPQWGQGFGIIAFGGYNDVNQIANLMPLYFIYRNTNEGQWFNWTLKNRLAMCNGYSNTPGTNLVYTNLGMAGGTVEGRAQWVYAYTDPAFPAIDMTGGGPTAAVLNHVDATSGTNYPQSALISRTGYGSITDTLLNFFGMGEWYQDHNLPGGGWYPGDYRIFKGNFLLAPDGGLNGAYNNISNNYNNGGALSGYMEIGGAYNLLAAGSNPLNTKMPRGVADSQNRFAYAMVDSSASYVAGAGVTRVHRHLVDFKSGQQIIVVYDDAATSGGKLKRTYLHYPNNSGASADASRGVTSLSGTTVTSSYPGTGHSDATQLLTRVLSPAGGSSVYVYTDNADGTFPGGSGSTFRVSICASATGFSCDATNTAAEFAVVHEPITGSGTTMAAATMLATIDVNHRGVQVDGASSKVAIFPRNGQTYTSTSFTSTHNGMAQYVVTGLAAGTYTVSGPVVLTNQSVDANGILYLDGAAGTYTVSRSGP